jgi:hypothetical protein
VNKKHEWIYNYAKINGHIDILNSDFVDDYIKKFNPVYKIQPYGANSCKELGRVLSSMYKNGLLNRFVMGIPYMVGFPRWVYCYEVI